MVKGTSGVGAAPITTMSDGEYGAAPKGPRVTACRLGRVRVAQRPDERRRHRAHADRTRVGRPVFYSFDRYANVQAGIAISTVGYMDNRVPIRHPRNPIIIQCDSPNYIQGFAIQTIQGFVCSPVRFKRSALARRRLHNLHSARRRRRTYHGRGRALLWLVTLSFPRVDREAQAVEAVCAGRGDSHPQGKSDRCGRLEPSLRVACGAQPEAFARWQALIGEG